MDGGLNRKSLEVGAVRRCLGDHRGAAKGPLLIVVGAIHGNEPAGVQALVEIFQELEDLKPFFHGRLVGLTGNCGALAAGKRYIDTDLNRAWTPANVERLRSQGPGTQWVTEAHEQRELLDLFDALFYQHPGSAYVLDLHTSSGAGSPFATTGDTLANRSFARQLPIPHVLGIEEQIQGGLLEYLNNRGHVTMGFEGGLHDDPGVVARHKAFLWLALDRIGCVHRQDIPDYLEQLRLIESAVKGVPRTLEIRYRHPVRSGDGFEMKPGWDHFRKVLVGDVLAHDSNGPIRAYQPGYMLLPLYQGQGDDGFFLGTRVPPFWLTLSTIFRRLGLARLAPLLPGIHAVPGDYNSFTVKASRMARWYPVEFLHVLGYRKREQRGDLVIFQRRRERA